MKTTLPRPKAFALAETLVVLAIIAIIAAMLAPSLMTWQSSVAQDRLRATSALLSQACSRAGLAGVAVPAGSRGTLADIVTWYQANGYIQPGRVDVSKLSLADFGDAAFTDCTNGDPNAVPVFAADASGLIPGPTAALWWNTRYIQLSIPSTPTGAQTLDLEGSADGVNWSVVAPGVTDSYTDGPFAPNTSRYYRIVAVTSTGRVPGPTSQATTAPPLSAPNSLSVVLGTTSGTTANPPPPAPLTYTIPAVPSNPGNSGTSGGLDWNTSGWQWLLSGTGQTASPYTGGATSVPLAPPGAITVTNLTSYSYTLTLPSLPHDLVDENGRIYDFAWSWMLFSSANGTSWTCPTGCEWRSTLGPPDTKTGFGWTAQPSGAWVSNPAPLSFDATPGSTYYYQLVGQDTAGLLVYGKIISITTPGQVAEAPVSPNAPVAPGQVAVSSLAQTSLTLTMPTLPDRATSLTLEASTDGGNSWVTVETGLGENEVVQQTNLTSATGYAYCVCAVNAYGTTQGTPKTVITLGGLPSVPGSVTTGNVTTSSYTFTLPQLPNAATSFTLQTSDNGLAWTNLATGLGGGAVVPITGLASNASAPYLLLAVNQYGYAPGAPFFATTGGMPASPSTPTVANLGATSFNLRLPALPLGATSLTLEASTDSGTTWAAQDGETGLAGLAVVSEAATPGATYAFRLVAVNQWGEAPGSSFTVTAPQTPAAPGSVTLSNLTDTAFRLLMPPLPTGADSLKLETTSDAITWLAEAGHDALAGGAAFNETGLTPNTAYSYRLVAVNQWGETPGSGFSVTTAGPPQAPGATVVDTVTPSSCSLHLPGLPVGASYLSLQTSPDGSAWTTAESNLDGASTVSLTGLAPFTTYNYRLTADNGYGSTAGAPFTAETGGLPSAPGEVAASGVTSSAFTLTLPALPAGATSLTLEALSGSDWLTDGTNSNVAGHTVIQKSGLAAGTTYQYQLLANNQWGSTPGLSFAVATTVNPPAAPGSLLVTGLTPTSVTLLMPDLSANAASLSLQGSTDAGATWTTGTAGLAGGATVTVSGLTPDTAYRYRALAVNAGGSTPGATYTVTMPSVPGTPDVASIIGLTPTSAGLRMPGFPAAATSLSLQSTTDAGTTWTTGPAGLASGTSVNVSGLTAGSTYTYRVLAVNAYGSTAGASFNVTTPTLPGVPDVAAASALAPTSFTLTMPALPASTTSLTLQASYDGGTTWNDANTSLAGGTTVSKTGLTPTTTYTYRVVAVNAYGSTNGNSFTVLTPSGLPSAPGVAASSSVTATSLTLTMPTLPANAVSLTLQITADGGSTWNSLSTGLAGGATAPQTGMTAGTTYTYRVLAVNSYGSTAGTTFTATTASLPSAPGVATPSNVTATSLTLTMPVLPANATSLTLQLSSNGGTTWNDANTGLAGGAAVSETGLTAGATYVFRVLAVNAYGSTAGASNWVFMASLPSTPGVAASSSVTATSFTLTLPSLPANTDSLTLQNSTDGGSTWNEVLNSLPGGFALAQSGLAQNTTYTYRVLAVNSYGSTAGSSFSVTTASLPGVPDPAWVNYTSATAFTVVMPSWLPANAASFTLQNSTNGGSTWNTLNTSLAAAAGVARTGLTTGASYMFRLLAVNTAGSTAGTSFTAVAGAPTSPGQPGLAGVSITPTSATSFNLTMPGLPTGATTLTLQTSTDGGTTWGNANTGLAGGAVVSKTGLTSGATYYYRVLAVNTNGSTAGAPFTAVAGAPASPGLATASSITSTSFNLTMPAKPATATSLTLQVMSGGVWTTDSTGLASGAVVSKTGMTSGTKYYYRVVSVGAGGSTPANVMTMVTTL